MTMKDDYLWEPSGTPDPDVERLEQVLGRLRTKAPAPRVRLPPSPPGGFGETRKPDTTYIDGERAVSYVGLRFLGPALAAAAAIVLMVGLTWQTAAPTAAWDVASLSGTPRIGSSVLMGEGRIAVGQTLTTDEASRARMDVSNIGQVTVDNSTRVRLVETRDGHHRLALERGTLHAVIAAPPGQFIVSTPSATATDLGCVYDLHVYDDGSGLLTVVAGWVAFEERGRESFVPSGASSRTDRINGPGTPRFDDTEQAFRDALDDVDNGRDPERGAASLRFALEHARLRDAMTLWHLIARVAPSDRAAVADALAARVPMPPAVTRDAVLRLDRAALDQWWDALGLDEATWWRKWKQPLATGAGAQRLAAPATDSCPATPTVRDTPSKDPSADGFGSGPWHVNADRTIWVHNWSFPEWRQGLNQKVMWIRPAGADLKISGERLDGPSAPLEARVPCCYPTGFQVSTITFPTAGCWKVTAKAGNREMTFVTNVRPRP
jgi:FecR protein